MKLSNKIKQDYVLTCCLKRCYILQWIEIAEDFAEWIRKLLKK